MPKQYSSHHTNSSAKLKQGNKIIFAHRGLSSKAPENTMRAFQLAADAGAKWIETDVDIIADGSAIIIHDSTLDRTTNKSGSIYDLCTPDLTSIDAGSWYGAEFAGERIPTLSQFVKFLNSTETNANIEIKQNQQGAKKTLQLIDTVAETLSVLDPQRKIIISSFSQPLLMKFHERHPQYKIGVLYEQAALYEDWLSVLELCGASYIHLEDKNLSQSQISAFIAAGYGVNVYTIDSIDRANTLFNWGCTGVFTNIADQMLHLGNRV